MRLTAFLIGLGQHMRENIYPAVLNDPRLKPIYCHDIDPIVTSSQAEAWHLRAMHQPDVDEGMRTADVIITSLPADQNGHYIENAIQLGKRIFVEKPGAWSSADIAGMQNPLAIDSSSVLVGFNFLFSAPVGALKQRLDELRSRGPRQCHMTFLSRHPRGPDEDSRSNLEAWLRLNAVHPFSIATYLFGESLRISRNRLSNTPSGFRMSCQMEHEGGDFTIMTIGNATPVFRIALSIECEPGIQLEMKGLRAVLETDHASRTRTTLYERKDLKHGFTESGYGGEISALLQDDFPQSRFVRLRAAASYLAQAEALLGSSETA